MSTGEIQLPVRRSTTQLLDLCHLSTPFYLSCLSLVKCPLSKSKGRPPKPRRGEKAAKYRPHRPQPPYRRKKTCKSGNSCTVDLRAVLYAVDNGRLAGDDEGKYRPRKVPANGNIQRHAGDAVDILRSSSAGCWRSGHLLSRNPSAGWEQNLLQAA